MEKMFMYRERYERIGELGEQREDVKVSMEFDRGS